MTVTDVPTRTSHRLQLPRTTDPADVLTMIRNVRPGASAREDGTLDLGHGSELLPDRSARGAGRWTLEVDRDREDPAPEGGDDMHGYGRAFPGGLPFGEEREALDLLWSLGRRFYGAVVTDEGARLEPHPFHVRDLTVVSPHALAPESLAQLVAPLEPEAELDEVPGDAARSGYSRTVPLGQGDEIALRVGRSERPAVLSRLGWIDRAVDYQLVHVPAEVDEDETERPDAATGERWMLAYQRIGLLAGLLVESVGGYVVDLEGFLVAPEDLG